MNYLPRFMTFLTMLCLNGLVIFSYFSVSLLILLPDSIENHELISFPSLQY